MTDLEQYQLEQLNERMSQAVNALERVAKHLRLKELDTQMALTIKEFDKTPESVREGWSGRKVGEAVRGSWRLAKGIAFNNARLPVAAERHYQQRQGLARKRREIAFSLSSVHDWLGSGPSEKQKTDYDRWRKKQRLHPGQPPLLTAKSIRERWQIPWVEIVEAVEQGEVPGQDDEQIEPQESLEEGAPIEPQGNPGGKSSQGQESTGQQATAQRYSLDSRQRAKRLKAARQARGWTIPKLALEAGIDSSNLSKIERSEIRNPNFETLLKLVIALELDLNEFLAPE